MSISYRTGTDLQVSDLVDLYDAEPGQRAFYEAMGFREIRDLEPSPRVFVRFNQG